MRMSKKIIISCLGLFVSIFLFYGLSQASSSVTKIFSSDDDFAHFNLTNIVTVGSNSGIRLQEKSAGAYKSSGEATYKFSPGVYAKWKKVTIVSTGTGLDVQFSTNNTDYSGIGGDGSFGNTVSSSSDLYIQIKMKSSNSNTATPILRSLAIEYENDAAVRVILEKRVYKCEPSSGSDTCQNANNLGQAEEKPTFEPGDIAGISIKINSALQSDVNFSLKDYLPNEAVLPIEVSTVADRSKYCHLSSSDSIITGANVDSEKKKISWENQTATSSDQYVCYRFGVGDNKNKNSFEQINATAYRSDVGYEKILGSSNSYMMIRGYPFIQSQEDTTLDSSKPFQLPVIEDELGFALTKILFSNPTQISNSSPSYVYIRGAGQKSRGGTLVSLPVKMTDLTGNNIFFEEQFYLLYNPIFYLFGNMFSGSSPSSTAFDFGRGSSSVSTGDFGNEKLNTASSLYNYYFDTQSVLFWDKKNRDKNKAMEENIDRIIGEEEKRPDNFCPLKNINALSGKPVYLNNKNCAISERDNSNIWPNGRVWYIKATSDIKISSTIEKGGTVVVDFGGTSADYKVKIDTKKSDFPKDSFLGLILINGGNVEFTTEATYFRGIVFAPGREKEGGGGRVVFAEDGESLLVRGSVIADEIDFNKRKKDENKYAVSVYLDGALINARIPGFEKLMDIIIGQ